jgi:rhodanese-related sulfurtransferase
MKTITPDQFHTLHRERREVTLIDVRSPAEFRTVHVQSAINLPLGDLDANSIASHADAEDDIYVICHSGGRSVQACEQLVALGFTNVVSVEGGTVACQQQGLPVNQGNQKMIPIERQVRIVAGTLILLGFILSRYANPSFIYLSVFVGAGLVFAGISGTCMMGLLLARMPWNR